MGFIDEDEGQPPGSFTVSTRDAEEETESEEEEFDDEYGDPIDLKNKHIKKYLDVLQTIDFSITITEVRESENIGEKETSEQIMNDEVFFRLIKDYRPKEIFITKDREDEDYFVLYFLVCGPNNIQWIYQNTYYGGT